MGEHPFAVKLSDELKQYPARYRPRGVIEGGLYRTRYGSLWRLDPTGRCVVDAPESWTLTSAEARRVANADSIYINLSDEPVPPKYPGDSPVRIHYYSHTGVLAMVDDLDASLHEDGGHQWLEAGHA